MPKPASCDLILPVYNSLTQVRACIASIFTNTDDKLYKLWVINDDSDAVTTAYLDYIAVNFPQIELINNENNLGFLKSCNKAMQLGQAEYVLLLNSDVIVSPNWLANMLQCANSDKLIASVNPLTNSAAQIEIIMQPGNHFLDMNWRLQEYFNNKITAIDVVTGVGFCLLLRRTALQEVGLFDEIYGHGYCEESDLCMRLTTRGYRTVVTPNVYVYHQGQASFGSNHQLYEQNRKIFDQRWRAEYKRQFSAFKRRNPLKEINLLFHSSKRWQPQPVIWTFYRILTANWHKKQILAMMLNSLRAIKQLSQAFSSKPDANLVNYNTKPDQLKITYLVNKLVISGGVLSIIQLVNGLILLGVEARIATLFVDPALKHWQLLTAPMVFRNQLELINNLPSTDIVVATHWSTANWAAQIQSQQPNTKSVYYLQDYEAWFSTEHKHKSVVIESYKLIPHKIVTSNWLKQLLAQDGYNSHKICIGVDIACFYPRPVLPKSKLIILTMARPGTPWRGFNTAMQALSIVKQQYPQVEIILFGDNQLHKQNISFAYQDEGLITEPNYLARLYSTADIFLDASDYQGFGRLSLEAMACNTACVLTSEGGINEYAKHEYNCLQAAPQQPQAFAQAIIRLLQDSNLRTQLAWQGLQTVQNYNTDLEAQITYDYFNSLVSIT